MTPIPRRKGQQPHLEKEAKHQPREARANEFREGKNNLHSEGQVQAGPSPHSKKAWRTSSTARKGQFLRARPVPMKEGPTTTLKGRANSHTKKEEATTTVRNTGKGQPKTREGRSQEGRANFHTPRANSHTTKTRPIPSRRRTTPRRKGQPSHLEEEWRTPPTTRKANPNKDGPNTTSRRPTTTPREGRANPNKEGSTITPEEEQPPRRKGRPPHQKTGPIPTRRKTSQPPTARRKNQTPHSKKGSQRNAPRRKGATPTKACQPSTPDRIAFAISCVTPDLKIENLKLVPDQTTPQIENANAIAIQIAVQIAIKIEIAIKLHLPFAFTFSICGLMWSCETFKFSIFNFQISNLVCDTKFEN